MELYKVEVSESLENPSSQEYKLNISYIINEQTAPIPLLGGIFGTFGVDKNGIKYYNYLENQKHKEMMMLNSSNNNQYINNSSNNSLNSNNINNINNNFNDDKDKLIKKILLKKLR